MFIKSLHVRSFRCIADATLECEPLTAIVGPNGCGKSSFLKALDAFFSSDIRILEEDFYGRDSSSDIEITIEFSEIDQYHQESLAPYLQGSSLKVTRIFSLDAARGSTRFFGYTPRHDRFSAIRDSSGAIGQKALYVQLREDPLYEDLPQWTKQADLPDSLSRWEDSHPEHCNPLRDDGNFFGLGAAAKFDLGQLVHVVFIPAVRDAAADATDMRGSPITELLDIAFRTGMSERTDFRELEADVETRYSDIVENAKQMQFRQVEERLSRTMDTFINNTSIKLLWRDNEKVKIPPPSADVMIVEDGFESPVARTGHGVQRAFTLSLLQEIAAVRLGLHALGDGLEDFPTPLPMLLLLIEEPELFQYPNRQRSIARTLQELSVGTIPGVAERTQVIYGTHNPLFVSVDRVEQVRVLRKVDIQKGAPKATKVKFFNSDMFLEDLASCRDMGEAVGEWSFHRMKLISIMTPSVNEGLFAKGVILVEGDIDRAGILAACSLENLNLEDMGISVIQCRGKANLVRLCIIFRQLGIEAFVVWDADANKRGQEQEIVRRKKENRELHRLVGVDPIDPPVTHIGKTFACILGDLEEQVRCELGEFYGEFMCDARDSYGMRGADAIKHPVVFGDLLKNAREHGHVSPTLDAIVDQAKKMALRI